MIRLCFGQNVAGPLNFSFKVIFAVWLIETISKFTNSYLAGSAEPVAPPSAANPAPASPVAKKPAGVLVSNSYLYR